MKKFIFSKFAGFLAYIRQIYLEMNPFTGILQHRFNPPPCSPHVLTQAPPPPFKFWKTHPSSPIRGHSLPCPQHLFSVTFSYFGYFGHVWSLLSKTIMPTCRNPDVYLDEKKKRERKKKKWTPSLTCFQYFQNAWSCPSIMIVSPCRNLSCSKCLNQLVGNFDVYLYAKNQLHLERIF